jgi:hypothetical protein
VIFLCGDNSIPPAFLGPIKSVVGRFQQMLGTRKALLDYCGQDTLALVKLLEKLRASA